MTKIDVLFYGKGLGVLTRITRAFVTYYSSFPERGAGRKNFLHPGGGGDEKYGPIHIYFPVTVGHPSRSGPIRPGSVSRGASDLRIRISPLNQRGLLLRKVAKVDSGEYVPDAAEKALKKY